MSIDSLVRVILEVSMFLEFSEENIVDPDSSVSQMEQIAATLSGMNEPDKAMFLEVCTKMAEEYSDQPEKAEYLLAFGESYGLVE